MLIYDKARLCGQGWLLNGGPTILYYFKNSKILVGEQMGQRQIALDIFFKKHELRLLVTFQQESVDIIFVCLQGIVGRVRSDSRRIPRGWNFKV